MSDTASDAGDDARYDNRRRTEHTDDAQRDELPVGSVLSYVKTYKAPSSTESSASSESSESSFSSSQTSEETTESSDRPFKTTLEDSYLSQTRLPPSAALKDVLHSLAFAEVMSLRSSIRNAIRSEAILARYLADSSIDIDDPKRQDVLMSYFDAVSDLRNAATSALNSAAEANTRMP